MSLKAHGLLLGILLLISQTVVNAALSISSPAPGTQVRQGDSVLVTWSGLETNATSISMTLREGSNLFPRAVLGIMPASTGGTRSVLIPLTVAPGTDYYIRLATTDIPAIEAIQGPITVTSRFVSSSSSSSSSSGSSSAVSSSTSSSASSVTSSSSSASSSLSSTIVSSTSSSSSPETNKPTDASNKSNSDSHDDPPLLSAGGIAGVTVGAVAIAGLVLAGCLCIRRKSREDEELADHTAAEIFAAHANHSQKENAGARVKSPPMANADYPMSPGLQHQSGQYYTTGYDGPYFNYNPGSPMYDHQQQQQQYAEYGYPPAAALTPQNQMATYGGYSNEALWANNPQYYIAPNGQQQQQSPYPTQNAYYQGDVNVPPGLYQQQR
ncbi:hypothetical protein BX666DRAFT_2119972 [Dichotomocladium elegans]|nr:hypothetical protein BX666DRAFT_2119972 [Dichotomocladium elegans]